MTALIVLFRIVHIFSAVTWAGGAFFLLSVIAPTVREAGQDGGRFMTRLATTGRVARIFSRSAVATVLSGVILYALFLYGFTANWLQTANGIVLTIGAIVGLAAFLHAMFAALPATNRMTTLAREMLAHNGPPDTQQVQLAQALSAKVMRNSTILAGMLAASLLFMAAAEYLSTPALR
jgi:uncharacterized membrane protein